MDTAESQTEKGKLRNQWRQWIRIEKYKNVGFKVKVKHLIHLCSEVAKGFCNDYSEENRIKAFSGIPATAMLHKIISKRSKKQLETDLTGPALCRKIGGRKVLCTFVALAFFWVSSQPHFGHTAGLCLFL